MDGRFTFSEVNFTKRGLDVPEWFKVRLFCNYSKQRFEEIFKFKWVSLSMFWASSKPPIIFCKTCEDSNLSNVSNNDKNYCVTGQDSPVCSRSRGDVDGKGHSKYSLVKTGFHQKFEKIHNGADLKDLEMIVYSKGKIQKIKQLCLNLHKGVKSTVLELTQMIGILV